MDIPDILTIINFDDFLKIAKKGPPKDPVPVLLFGKDRKSISYPSLLGILVRVTMG